ncbi:MAG: alpha/beta family hydrolase [Pseudomonadota bacterium]
MNAHRVVFKSGDLNVEGMMDDLPGNRGVLITHPHPLYGGDMENDVVRAVAETYAEKGYSTLRFNFRGVGMSEGTHDEGVGEQEDVRAALKTLYEKGKTRIDLAGYSFGAWVNALGLESYKQAGRLIMVSPPVSFVDFRFLRQQPKIKLVVVGSRDDFASLETIEELVPQWNPEAALRIIRGANHFYMLKLTELKSIIGEFLDQTSPDAP